MDNFRQMIEGKKVLLVGPAAYLGDKSLNLDLSKFDLIVKINKMVEKSSFSNEVLNSRNEVLYHCLDINIKNGDLPYDIDTWVKKKVKHLRITHPPVTHYYNNNLISFYNLNKNFNLENSVVSKELFFTIQEKTGTSPNAGTIAICDLLYNNVMSLHIIGMTFCKTPYSQGYKEQIFYDNKNKNNQHDHDKQILFFKKLLKEYKEKIIIDDELLSIIRSY